MSKVISIVNMKGGVGKTTLSIALTDYIASVLQKKVCLVDLDAQSNASFAMAGEDNFEEIVASKRTIDHFFINHGQIFQGDPLEDYVIPEASNLTDGGQNISLVASSPRLRLVERQILIKLARANFFDQELEGRAAAALRAGFKDLTSRGTYVVVDSAPGISGFAFAALKASDLVIAPVNPDYLSAIGLELLGREILSRLKPELRPPLLACRTKVQATVNYPRYAYFEKPEFQDKAGFVLMGTDVPLKADLGRIVDRGDVFQSLARKYESGLPHVVAFGTEVMSRLEARQ